MGKYNSSLTRVNPLGDAIINNHKLVDKLLSLVMSSDSIEMGDFSNSNVFYSGGQGEKALKPSLNHLGAIIEKIINDEKFRSYIRQKDKSSRSNKILRNKLFSLDMETIKLARSRFKDWNTFETASYPDLFIENDKFIIVIEGKRTETDITRSTTYLPNRCQMVRHIENALEYCKDQKRVIGFYVIEDTCGYEDHCSIEYFKECLEKETIKKDNKLKSAIINSFYGYTTWQEISNMLRIVFPKD